ncbi:MAG: hypothetical protein GEU26_07040 [Nitrososphaeraceae archaeon]|nr:hypothetical protein [Nitrososphaeraceae archaeon]
MKLIDDPDITIFHSMEFRNENCNLSMQRDSIATSFREDNDGRVFQIELDALNALMSDDFITLLEDSVDRHFDESIYEEVMEDPKHSTETIWR